MYIEPYDMVVSSLCTLWICSIQSDALLFPFTLRDASWFHTSCLPGVDWLSCAWDCLFFFFASACISCSTAYASVNVFKSLYCPRFPSCYVLKVLEDKLKYGASLCLSESKKKGTSNGVFFLQRTKLFTERNFKGADSLFLSWNTHNPLHSRLRPSGVNLFHSTVQFTRWIMLLKEQHLPDMPEGVLLFMWPCSFFMFESLFLTHLCKLRFTTFLHILFGLKLSLHLRLHFSPHFPHLQSSCTRHLGLAGS